jgi:hypothetical protein
VRKKKTPHVGCDKYDEEETKSLFEEEKKPESFSGSIDEE